MPTIPGNSAADPSFPVIGRYVTLRKKFADKEDIVPYLQPISSREAVGEISYAEVNFNFGEIKREDSAVVKYYSAIRYHNYYVTIYLLVPGYPPVAVWTGIANSDCNRLTHETIIAGESSMRCLGLEYLLDREIICNSFASNDGITAHRIWSVPTFNYRDKKGFQGLSKSTRELKGNCSPNLAADSEHVFYYGDDAILWTAGKAIRRILKDHAPTGIKWELGGQLDALDQIESVWEVEGLSVKQALDRILNRRFGMGWYLTPTPTTVYITVFTYTDVDIAIGNKELPANPNQGAFVIPDTYPFTHVVDDFEISYSAEEEYDNILIQGDPIMVCATFSWRKRLQDPSKMLVNGWTQQLQQQYDQGALAVANGQDPDANDTYRAQDQFKDVYTRFIVPPDWDWWTGYIDQSSVAYVSDDDGIVRSLDPTTAMGCHTNKQFMRHTPFRYGVAYDLPKIDGQVQTFAPVNSEPEYLPIMAFFQDPSDFGYFLADKARLKNEDFTNMSVRPLDSGMGIQIGADPNHRLAYQHLWNGNASNFDPTIEPAIDYRTLVVTAFFKIDQRQTIYLQNISQPPHETQRTLVINCKAEYWVVAHDTRFKCSNDGIILDRVHQDHLIMRDDLEILQAAAAVARPWFSRRRQSARIPYHTLGLFAPLGSIMTQISGIGIAEPINSVVTGRSIDYRGEGRSTTETGHCAFDEALGFFRAFVEEDRGEPASRPMEVAPAAAREQ